MRKDTEPVADFHGFIGPAGVRRSYVGPLAPDQMPVNHWVECEGFEHLRILAVGDGGFDVLVIMYAEDNPAVGVMPTRFTEEQLNAVPMGGFAAPTYVVADSLDLTGIRGIGIELQNHPLNGEATEISLHAFLR